MKKRLASVFLAALLLLLSGCAAAEGKLLVTATFYPLYVAALNITRGVEGVEVRCMAPAQAGCLHDYQLTTEDRRTLSDSDVIIHNGAGLEGFLDKLLPILSANAVEASEGIALLPGGHEDEENAHVWVSITGMIAQVENIARGLSRADPDHAELYAQNAADYVARLEALHQEMREALAPFGGMPIVTFHEAFDYFAADFDLVIAAVVELDHGSAPSAKELANVVAIIKEQNVCALFAEPQYEDTSVDILSRETGVPVYLLDPAVSGVVEPEAYDAYMDVMRQNMVTLVEALS